ncbi:hypothetical protein, partial [Enterobacter hormaechei]|uniref:hypothetical protein n=1 Tax=Enterobacter hormaechei TaxID=158836 RepID=UPI0023E3B617
MKLKYFLFFIFLLYNPSTFHQFKNMIDPNHSIQLNNLLKQYLDGTTIPSVDVIIVENMDTLAKTAQGIT